jgi:hypothetical protein
MNVTTALTKMNYAIRGIDDEAPLLGTDEANYWVSTLNDRKDSLYNDTKHKWTNIFNIAAPNELGTASTTATTTLTGTDTNFTDYKVGDLLTVLGETVRTIATISSDTSLTVTVAFSNTASDKTLTHKSIIAAGIQSYNLHRSFIIPSDATYITKTDGVSRYYEFEHPQERSYNMQSAYITGDRPKVITFTKDILSTDDIVGGSLFIPGYFLPADMSLATDELPFPDPNWGIMSAAAEIAFNDIIYEDKASDINTKANALFAAMTQANRTGTYRNPRTIPTRVNRIRDTRVR